MDHRLSVIPHARVRGWKPDGARYVHTITLPLAEALSRSWPTDAHCTQYVADHRLVKDYAPDDLSFRLLIADIDNPGHVAWTEETIAEARERWFAWSGATVGVYSTRSGLRFVQPLSSPVPRAKAEATIRAWHAQLIAAGWHPDERARDWTRLFRLPFVVRDGLPTAPELYDLSRMRPVEPPEVPEPAPRSERVRIARKPRAAVVLDAGAWESRLVPVREAIARTSDYGPGLLAHDDALRVAGALLQLGVDTDAVPGLVAALASGNDAARVANRTDAARDTVRRYMLGLHCSGLESLHPAVRDALTIACTVAEQPRGVDLYREIAHAPPGVSLLSVECGGGKTATAIAVARDRAASKPATEGRETSNVRTVISVPNHALAQQVARDLGVPVRVRLGVLAHPAGCIYAEEAAPLVAGGQSLRNEYCDGRGADPCPLRETCEARSGVLGDPDARITITPHALLAGEADRAGETALVFVDEPPPLYQARHASTQDLSDALENLRWFDPGYREIMRPLLEQVHALATGGDAFDLPTDRPTGPPPLLWGFRHRGRMHRGFLAALGAASGLLLAIQDAVRIAPAAGGGVLIITRDAAYIRTLQRDGVTVLADAGAAVHIEPIARELGSPARFVRAAMPDGAPIERTLYAHRGASRKALLGDSDASARAVSQVVSRVLAWGAGERLLIVSFKALLERKDTKKLLEQYTGEVATAHYGAIRGRNDWAGFDCVATIGDPFQNVEAVDHQADLVACNSNQLGDELARAELEQAHGRLRCVHRTRPGRALHVGRILPGGYGWTPDRVRVIERAAVSELLQELGSVDAVAEHLRATTDAVRAALRREKKALEKAG